MIFSKKEIKDMLSDIISKLETYKSGTALTYKELKLIITLCKYTLEDL